MIAALTTMYVASVLISYFLKRSTIKAGYPSGMFDVIILIVPAINVIDAIIGYCVFVVEPNSRKFVDKIFAIREDDK